MFFCLFVLFIYFGLVIVVAVVVLFRGFMFILWKALFLPDHFGDVFSTKLKHF